MQAPEALQGPNNGLNDLSGHDRDVEKPPAPPSAAEGPSVKAPVPESAHDSHRRSGRTRTMRVRDGFFDSSLLHYVSMNNPSVPHVPEEALAKERSPALKTSSTKAAPVSTKAAPVDIPISDDDTPTGPDYQASIPPWRPRPAQPTAAEAKFLPAAPLYTPVDPVAVALAEKTGSKTRAGRAGVTGPMPPTGVAASSSDFRYKYRWAKDGAGRRKLVSAAVNALDKQLGPEKVKVLGLEGLGFKRAQSWQPHEELLFCLGMCDKYRMFKYIRQCYLWSRSAHELNGYYHNVWKTRSTPEAEEFLTLKVEEASREEFEAFFDKVRDKLTAMWDRKKMGDMPKLVKDMAAAAAAAAAAAPANKERNKRVELLSSSEDESEDASDSSTSTADDSSSSRRAARSKQKQRKRSAAAVTGGAADKASNKKAKRSTSTSQLLPSHTALPQQKQPVQQQQQQQQRRRVDTSHRQRQRHQDLPTPTGTAALAQWLHPGQQQYQQRPRSGPRSASETSTGARLHDPLKLPDMPHLPRPDPHDPTAVAAWLKALPVFKEAMSSYVETVSAMTTDAILDCQQHINTLKQQREQSREQADAYLHTLLAQGQELLADMTAKQHQQQQGPSQSQQQQLQAPSQQAQQQQQQQGAMPSQQEGAVPAAEGKLGAEQEQPAAPGEQQQQLDDQLDQAGIEKADGREGGGSPTAAAADTVKQGGDQPEQEDQAAAPDAVSNAKGPFAENTTCCGQQPQHDTGRDSHQQHQDQQQQQQQQHTLLQGPAADGPDLGSPLPFPGGPLSKWLAPRLQSNGSSDSAVIKHIPRPYVKRPKLEGGGTLAQE